MYGLKFLTLAIIAGTGKHFFSFPGQEFLAVDAMFLRLKYCIWAIPYAQKALINDHADIFIGTTRQHAISGYHRSASKTPFKWRFAGGPIVACLYKLTG